MNRALGIALLSILSAAPALAAPRAAPRRLSDAERAAMEIAGDYLARGPKAIVERLDPESPFKRLPPADLEAEIEVRLAPREGADWELRTPAADVAADRAIFRVETPGGEEDLVVLELRKLGDSFAVKSVRNLAETAVEASPADGKAPIAAPVKAPFRIDQLGTIPLLAGFCGVVLLLATLGLSGLRPVALRVAGAALVAFAALLGWRELALARNPKGAVAEKGMPVRLSSLLPLRRALAAGDEAKISVEISRKEPPGAAGEIRRLWQAQAAMRRGELPLSERILGTLDSPSRRPAVEIARARVAALSRREADAALSYDRAVRLGPSQDGLWLEAAGVLDALGYDKRALDYLERCARIGSREPEVYFRLAEEAAIAHQQETAEALFATGWALRPMERSDLFDSAPLWWFLSTSRDYALLSLETWQEPVVARAAIARSSVRFPVGSDIRTCGDTLRVRIGAAALSASGGSELAPEGTLAEDAAAPMRQEEHEALAKLEDLTKLAGTPAAMADASIRTRLMAALRALDRDRRSPEIVALTEGIAKTPDRLPGNIVRVRAAALRRLGRTDDERKLLLAYASSSVAAERRDPATLLQLSESFVSLGEYDIATRLVGRAFAQLPFDPPGDRVLRIALEKRLAQSFEVLESPDFTIRYPKDADARATVYISDILSKERRRLEKWVPGTTKKIGVDLLPVDDFMHVFAGDASIVGLWDGRIRLPLAGLRLYMPELVAIMTHELLHGILAEATGDRAPKWFHEGLAQHVEMVRFGANPFLDYAKKGRILSLSAVERVLETFPDPELVAQAYDQAAWTLHYIEKSHGEDAIRRMVAEFAAGANSEQVVSKVLGRTMAELDSDLSSWWLGGAPKIWTAEIVRYDAPEPTIRPKDPKGMRKIPIGIKQRGFPAVGTDTENPEDEK